MTTTPEPAGVRGPPERDISERQLDDDMLRLQRAAAASHERGQQIEAVRVSAGLGLALSGVVVTLLGEGRTAVALIGFVWFLASNFFFKGLAVRTARQGALLQEKFDISLFGLPWRATVAGESLREPDVYRLARSLHQGGAKDRRITDGWYDPAQGVHHPLDAFIAQEQNLGWDTRLRLRYSWFILASAVAWAATGLVVGVAVPGTTLSSLLLSFYVPSLAVFQLAIEIFSGQRRVATVRERLVEVVMTELRNAKPGPLSESERHRLMSVAREVQDGIFNSRLEVTRVPEWFYARFRDDDERDFADTAEGHRARLAEQTPPGD